MSTQLLGIIILASADVVESYALLIKNLGLVRGLTQRYSFMLRAIIWLNLRFAATA